MMHGPFRKNLQCLLILRQLHEPVKLSLLRLTFEVYLIAHLDQRYFIFLEKINDCVDFVEIVKVLIKVLLPASFILVHMPLQVIAILLPFLDFQRLGRYWVS